MSTSVPLLRILRGSSDDAARPDCDVLDARRVHARAELERLFNGDASTLRTRACAALDEARREARVARFRADVALASVWLQEVARLRLAEPPAPERPAVTRRYASLRARVTAAQLEDIEAAVREHAAARAATHGPEWMWK